MLGSRNVLFYCLTVLIRVYTSISDNVLAAYVLDLFQAKKVYFSRGHFAKLVKSQLKQQIDASNRALELPPLPVIYMSALQSPPPPLPLLTTYHTQPDQSILHTSYYLPLYPCHFLLQCYIYSHTL